MRVGISVVIPFIDKTQLLSWFFNTLGNNFSLTFSIELFFVFRKTNDYHSDSLIIELFSAGLGWTIIEIVELQSSTLYNR